MVTLRLSCKTPAVEFNSQGWLDVIKGEPAHVNKVLWNIKQALKPFGVEVVVEGE
jgi:hypothetical protein